MMMNVRMKSLVLSAASLSLLAGPAFAQTAVLVAPTAPAPATPPTTAAALAGLDAYIEGARGAWQMPGLSIAIVKDDQIVYSKGFGVREEGKPGKVDADTVFAIGSASKAFTSAALGMLVDEKKIGWDGTVHDYMPSFELHDPYVTRHVTVRDLLSHRTGVVTNGNLWYGSGFDRQEIIRRLRFQTETLGFRNKYQYQNEMFIVAGEVVGAVSGMSYDRFVASRIFAPLGMRRTSTSVTDLKALANVASPHVLVDGKAVPVAYRLIDNVGGAGAINSSARDMAQWLRLQLGGGMFEGKQLIAPATLAEMHSGQIVLPASAPDPLFKFTEYGLAWGLREYRGQKVVVHTGAIDGMNSAVAMIPDRKLGVVVLTNGLPSSLAAAVQLRVLDAFIGGPATDHSAVMKQALEDTARTAQEKAAAAAPSSAAAAPARLPLDRYAGTYSSELLGDVVITLANGKLMLARPQATAVLEHERSDMFKAQWSSLAQKSIFGETPAGFTFGADGAIATLDLGGDTYARKHGQ
ncbi:CubicO group peptidase (beta-lactamase class C family) [Sphingopyxis panaciterrae]|uniref:serine hydrolase n=1 Tax=Sphingopyxis panaciterrae TaxID=363841 RepID=UPI0014204DD0|nr:serine hydrolase [Sphingopyxis panaciterrae]NIJ35655.1 CubicO group peptidase (beta-lactamase class C family) [Sphingopyxis panaciterrae]